MSSRAKFFQLTRALSGLQWPDAEELNDAAELGWDIVEQGLGELDALSIGEECVDDDGDTWERVQ